MCTYVYVHIFSIISLIATKLNIPTSYNGEEIFEKKNTVGIPKYTLEYGVLPIVCPSLLWKAFFKVLGVLMTDRRDWTWDLHPQSSSFRQQPPQATLGRFRTPVKACMD